MSVQVVDPEVVQVGDRTGDLIDPGPSSPTVAQRLPHFQLGDDVFGDGASAFEPAPGLVSHDEAVGPSGGSGDLPQTSLAAMACGTDGLCRHEICWSSV